MYSQQELDDAVAAGAITSDSANALRAFVANQRHSTIVDEEQFRLLTGFNDIFVAIAGVILLFAVGWIGHSLGAAIDLDFDGNGPSPLSGAAVAATAWGLASYFTARRRMALPSILFLFAFIGGLFWAAGTTLGLIFEDAIRGNDDEALAAWLAAVAAAVAAAGAYLHWRRFKVPVTVAAGAVSAAGIIGAIVVAIFAPSVSNDALDTILLVTALLLGIGVFLFAMRWDMADPSRVTRKSDVAFWLHLAAAPMIVHPVFALLGLTGGSASVGEGVLVIILYVALAGVALAIDRRAVLVSGLLYVLFALTRLFEEFGAVELNIALTAFVIGSALLLLSAFWHEARGAVLKILPAGLVGRLPDLHSVRRQAAAEVSPSQA
ncbi:hypothetical protein WJT74_07170 [Sphingomicrobium sp. XHP0239]|uniref:hypothetical protein n=1 Tax=Sphingomicrobium maritimum TaxID=3133972 RepID=UPI0031CCBEF1